MTNALVTITSLTDEKKLNRHIILPRPWKWVGLSSCHADVNLLEETVYQVFQSLVKVTGTDFSGVSKKNGGPFYQVTIEVGDRNKRWEEGSIDDYIELYGFDVKKIGKRSKWNRLVIATENWIYHPHLNAQSSSRRLGNDEIAQMYQNGWRLVDGEVMFKGNRDEASKSFCDLFPNRLHEKASWMNDFDIECGSCGLGRVHELSPITILEFS